MSWRVEQGDCIEVMAAMPEASVDAIVCDPPYGLGEEPDIAEVLRHWLAGDDYVHRGGGFMGKSWDSFVPGPAYWTAAYRALKPGGHLLAFGGTRTYDMLVTALRLSGFGVRDTLAWLYGSGFPKSLDVSKAIDKAAGAEREVLAEGAAVKRMIPGADQNATGSWIKDNGREFVPTVTVPATPDAERWEGWGTALKPGHEPIVVARKPLAGTVAANVLAHGTGALNVGGCRIEGTTPDGSGESSGGRWPANVVLSHGHGCVLVGTRKVKGSVNHHESKSSIGDGKTYRGGAARIGHDYVDADGMEEVEAWECTPDCPVRMLDEQTGELAAGNHPAVRNGRGDEKVYGSGWSSGTEGLRRPTKAGAASRFFYCAKPDADERQAGLGDVVSLFAPADVPDRNDHPTVKPIDLMRWLVRLVTPPGGVVLDPFVGSGTTGCAAVLEGFDFIGVEREAAYASIARARIAHWSAGAAEVVA